MPDPGLSPGMDQINAAVSVAAELTIRQMVLEWLIAAQGTSNMSQSNTAGSVMTCPYCAKDHAGMRCPLVKSLDYHKGTVARVEFFSPAEMAVLPILQQPIYQQRCPQET